MPRRQLHLFDLPPARRVLRAHVADVHGSEYLATFRCSRCGWASEWTRFRTVSEAKRGIPCGICNMFDLNI